MTDKNIAGILQPVLENRWRVRVPLKGWEDDHIITRQAVSVAVNYAKRELVLEVEQPVTTARLHEFFYGLAKHNTLIPISVEPMDGNEGIYHAVQYNCKIKDHKFDLDYRSNGAACHIVTFEIANVITRERDADSTL